MSIATIVSPSAMSWLHVHPRTSSTFTYDFAACDTANSVRGSTYANAAAAGPPEATAAGVGVGSVVVGSALAADGMDAVAPLPSDSSASALARAGSSAKPVMRCCVA